jgi:hypothetical protein
MRFLSSIKIVRVTLALAVAFWMAGAGCMLGCENMVSAAIPHDADATSSASSSTSSNAANIVVAADACASMHAHDCCARRGAQPVAKSRVSSSALPAIKPAEIPVASFSTRKAMQAKHALSSLVSGDVVAAALAAPFSTMMDCPLAVNATAALSKARPDNSRGDLLPVHAADSFSYFKEQLTALTPPSLLPNRGRTYLRCCVFLI